MRLLFIVSREERDPRAAGGDVQGSAYARYLAAAGHHVTYLTGAYPGAPAEEVYEGVRVIRLGRPTALPVRAWRWYRRHGASFDAVYAEAIGGSRVPLLAPLYVRQPLIAPWYQVNRPVFVHEYGRLAGSLLAWMEVRLAHLHGRATIVTPTEERRADLVRLGFRPEQVVALPPVAVEDGHMPAQPPAGREPLIVWLGKLRRYKCVHFCVQAMPAVIQACPHARLVIAGRRDDERYLRQLRDSIEQLGLGRSAGFALDLSEREKRELLSRARMLVLPSPVEGFGIVILEAGAAGTPAVVSEGVPEEVVLHEHNGLRVPFADVGALAAAIVRIIRSPALHERLALNAMDHARSFSRAAIQARLEEVLQRAVGGETGVARMQAAPPPAITKR